MSKKLVIVESPAKARTLARILGAEYDLKASLGHIRDLPKSQLGVDTEKDFAPKYIIIRAKTKAVNELKKAVKAAGSVYLATDPDREGEAIAWHLMEATKANKTTYRRVVFHEITSEAIKRAFKTPRPLDQQLVNAQQARRILDRLVGYKLSPLLWRKVRGGLSAGRVQSVAVRIVVDREREIDGFKSEEFWTIEAELAKKPATGNKAFWAQLTTIAGSRPKIGSQQQAEEIGQELKQSDYAVSKVTTKQVKRQPRPPFITSSLQQEAWRKLRFSAKQTMAVAQQLYEGLPVADEGNVGLITYMRTDSTHVARPALVEAREFIGEKYGKDYLPPHARTFFGRVKGAQEAHEAIRPTRIFRQPSLVKAYLNTNQFKLYQLIWQRMVASQMAAALFDSTTVEIEARHSPSKTKYIFRASSLLNTFPGFITLYKEGRDEEEEKKGPPLPPLDKGDQLEMLGLFPEQRFTKPPPRYTEATLIKALEQWGIGRPSTYAPILSTIQERQYVDKAEGGFKPTELGIAVNDLLVKHFGDIVNVDFSAVMEEKLDKVASENMDWVAVVRDFYTPFEKDLEKASTTAEKVKLATVILDETCPECGKPLEVKTGRFGKFIACSGYPDCKYKKSFQVKLGVKCPECGGEIVERRSKGRPFYGCSNYPKCRFATNTKPLPLPCPSCGGLLSVYRLKWEKCRQCDYKGQLRQG
jgi:DNA topoisomerase-1